MRLDKFWAPTLTAHASSEAHESNESHESPEACGFPEAHGSYGLWAHGYPRVVAVRRQGKLHKAFARKRL